MINTFHKKIPQAGVGLALGSGSARGWAHIGVIRALVKKIRKGLMLKALSAVNTATSR